MSLDKILRKIIVIGLFTVPFIVLIVAESMFFPYVVGKNFTFRIIVEIIFAAWILLALINIETRPRRSLVLGSVTLFVAITAIADVFGVNPFKSFWSNFERMEGLITFLHLLAYIVVWGTVLNTERLRIWFWQVSIAVSVLISSNALLQLLSGEKDRLESTLGNPIYLAVYVLFHIFIAAILALRRSAGFATRFILSSIILLELIVLYLTATRGATLGLIAGMFIAAAGIAFTERENLKLRKLATSVVLVVLVLVSGFFILRDSALVQESPVLKRFAHISLTQGTVMARTYVWGMATEGVKERPMLGWGQENFNHVFNKYYDPRMYGQEQWFDRTHNIVFDTLITSGILGLAAYISIFLALLLVLYKTSSFNVEQKWLMVGLLVAYTFHNLTVFDNVTSYILFFSVIAWIYTAEAIDSDLPAGERISNWTLSDDLAKKAGLPAAIVLATILVWSINSCAYKENKALLSVLSNVAHANHAPNVATAVERANAALLEFEKVENYNSYGTQESREHFLQQTASIHGSSWAPAELKVEYFKKAKEAMLKQKQEAPNDPRFPLFLSGLYQIVGDYEREKIELEIARELSPTKQTIILKQGVNAFHLKRPEQALEFFRVAHELDKSYKQAGMLYFQLAEQMKSDK